MKRFTTFWGLISAYWISERWREAWVLSAVVLAITGLLSKAAVWTATASADFLASLAEFHRPDVANPGRVILLSAAAFFGIFASRALGVALRHLVSITLHRRARRWLVTRFDAEILSDPRIALDLMSDRGSEGRAGGLPGRHRPAPRRLHRRPLRRPDRPGDGLLGGGGVDLVRHRPR